MKQNVIFRTLSWIPHKSKRPVKSIGAAEILAASEGMDEGKVPSSDICIMLGIDIELSKAVDSKDLLTSLSTQCNSIDRSIRRDENSISYEFETHKVNQIYWIPGVQNLADILTKRDSPLSQPFQLLTYSGLVPIDFPQA